MTNTIAKPTSANRLAPIALFREEIDLDTGDHSVVLSTKTTAGLKKIKVSREQLLDNAGLERLLVKKGLRGGLFRKGRGAEILRQIDHPKVRVTERSGWYDKTLVTRYGVLTPMDEGKPFQFRDDSANYEGARRAGSLREFLALIRPYLLASPELLFAYMLALVPPLAARMGRTGGFVVCYSAESSTGKTTCARLAQSLSTSADEVELVNFGDTIGILIDSAPAFAAQITCFGDIKAGTEKGSDLADKIQTVAFSAVNGRPRRRKHDTTVPAAGFNVYFLTTEETIASVYEKANKPLQDGDKARLINIEIPPRDKGGILSAYPKSERRSRIGALSKLLDHHHGHVMPEWAARLRDLEVSRAQRREAAILLSKPQLDGLGDRVTKHFALIELAGIAAVRAGVLPVEVEEVAKCVNLMLRRVVGAEGRKAKRTARAYRNVLKALAEDSRFHEAQVGQPVNPDALQDGFRRNEKRSGAECTMLYLPQSAFEGLVPKKLISAGAMLARLKDLRVLEVGRDGYTKSVEQKGIPGRSRYLCINRTALDKVAPALVSTET